MLALFNSLIVKAVLIILSAFFFNFNASVMESFGGLVPSVTMEGGAEPDSLSKKSDETAKKSVRISISDDGIKVKRGDKDQLILDEKNLQSLIEKQKSIMGIADSLTIQFDIGEEDRYTKEITGDRVKIGNDVEVRGFELVQGSAVAVFGGLKVDGKVKGDAVSIFGNLKLGPAAVVNGDVVCVMGHLDKDENATVRGQTISIGSANMADVGFSTPVGFPFMPFQGRVFKLLLRLIIFLGSVLLLLLIVYFIPHRIDRSADHIAGSFLKSVGVGALVFVFGSILVLIVAVIIGITIIGIPVSILMVLCYVAFIFLGYFVGAFALGRAVSRKFNLGVDSRYVQGIIGLLILAMFGIISSGISIAMPFMPFAVLISLIGKFVSFLALLSGVGAFIISRAGTVPVSVRPAELTEE